MAMLEMQADMQQQHNSYFFGHYSTKDTDLNGNIHIWPSTSGNDNIVWPPRSVDDGIVRNGKPYNCSPESLPPYPVVYQEMVGQTWLQQEEAMPNRQVVTQYPDHQHLVFKEMVKQTMLKQESVFKDQVHSLHHLYNRHREMLDELRSRQVLNTYNPQLEMLRSNPIPSQFSHEQQKPCGVATLPWLTRTLSQSSVSAARNYNLIDLNHSDGEVSTDVHNPAQGEGYTNEVSVLNSKLKRYGKKILDLERPAEDYIDGEEQIALALEDEGCLKESCGEILKSDTESSYGIMDLNLEYQEGETFQAFPRKSKCLADLNEPVQLDDDEAHPDCTILKQSLEVSTHGLLQNETTISVDLKTSADVLNGDMDQCMGINDLNCTDLEDNVLEDSKCGKSNNLADLNEPFNHEEDAELMEPMSIAFLDSDPGPEISDQLGKVDSNLQDDQAEVSDKEETDESCSSALDVEQSETEELPSNNDGADENSKDSDSLSGEMTSTLSENNEQVEQVPLAQTEVRRSGRLRWERTSFIQTATERSSSAKLHNRRNVKFLEIVQALPCEKSPLYVGLMSKPRYRAIAGAKSSCDSKTVKRGRKRKSACHSSASTDPDFEDEHNGSKKGRKGSFDEHSMLLANVDDVPSTPSSLSREDVDTLSDPMRTAAVTLVSISSQFNTQGATSTSSGVPHFHSLYCLASVVASVANDPDADHSLSSSRDGAGLNSNETDYFEAMTLKLPELGAEEHNCSNVTTQMEGETVRRGKLPKRDFQNEVLPSLVSLSRYEVTEDLQVIGSMSITAAARSQSNTSLRHTKKRGKKRASAAASNVVDSNPSLMQLEESRVKVEEGWMMDWGKVTRRRRGQRFRISLMGLLTFATRFGEWMN